MLSPDRLLSPAGDSASPLIQLNGAHYYEVLENQRAKIPGCVVQLDGGHPFIETFVA